jgi:hypothetical protein
MKYVVYGTIISLNEEKKMKSKQKGMFLFSESVCEPGPSRLEFYYSIGIFNGNEPWFIGEVIESNKCNGDSSVLISNVDELKSFQAECSFHSVWCVIPRSLTANGEMGFEELVGVERSVIQPGSEESPIYRIKFKSGCEIIFDLADAKFPVELLVFEPFLSIPSIKECCH